MARIASNWHYTHVLAYNRTLSIAVTTFRKSGDRTIGFIKMLKCMMIAFKIVIFERTALSICTFCIIQNRINCCNANVPLPIPLQPFQKNEQENLLIFCMQKCTTDRIHCSMFCISLWTRQFMYKTKMLPLK